MRREHEKKKKSYFKTVLLSMLAVSIVTTIFLSAFLTANYLKTAVDTTAGFNQNLLSQTSYTITQMNDNAERLTKVLFNNNDIVSFLYMKEVDPMVPVLASRTLDKQLVTLPYIESVYLYNASLDLFYSSKSGEQLKSGEFKDSRIGQLVTDPGFVAQYDGIPIAGAISGTTQKATTLSYIIFDPTATDKPLKNAIVINVKPSTMTDSINSMNQFKNGLKMDFIIMDREGTVLASALSPELSKETDLYPLLYDSIPELMDEKSSGKGHFLERSRFLSIGGKAYFQSTTSDNENGWYLFSLVPSHDIFKEIITSSLMGAGIMILVLLGCGLACFYLARRLNTPIRTIASMMKGEAVDGLTTDLQGTEEFGMIVNSFQAMQEQNQQFDQMRRETAYSIKQDCLNTLLTGNITDPYERTQHKLMTLNLSYLLQDALCMAVFKIDNYEHFLAENNPKELWVLRFAVVNITEEVASEYFTCNVFSRDNDKFVVLIDCKEELPYKAFQEKLETMLADVRQKVRQFMQISLTAAYSTRFHGLDHLPTMYSNMCDSLLLKMKYGHGSIISPYMVDEVASDIFQFPVQKSEQLSSRIADGKTDSAVQLYGQISSQLFQYDYNEILSGIIHLVYSIYTDVLQKYPEMKEEFTEMLKRCLADVQSAEISADIDRTMGLFMEGLCGKINEFKNENAKQSTDLITGRICQLVEQQYPDPSLCLSSIAEELGFSPNYIGRIFKNAVQKSIAQYILDYRMDKLDEYMRNSNLSLTAILEKVGIEKNNYFYTQFKKHFGISLGEYRLQLGRQENDD